MLNIGPGQLMMIFIIALIALGPDKLPQAMRTAGRIMREMRRISTGFQDELRHALDEQEETLEDRRRRVDRETAGAAGAAGPGRAPRADASAADGADGDRAAIDEDVAGTGPATTAATDDDAGPAIPTGAADNGTESAPDVTSRAETREAGEPSRALPEKAE